MKQAIGTTADGKAVSLPEDAVTQGFAILARRRSGKSQLAGVMEETFCARGDPWVCLDPVSAHWGIRYQDNHDRPGKPSGLDVLIVGGKQGDVGLDEHSGGALAEIICQTEISCIIDLGDTTLNARQKFVADFANELYRINDTPRHVFLEEADEFVPQQLEFDNQKLVRGALERLIKGGGGRGIGFTLITQRPASVSKKCLTQIDNLFAMRMVGPQDLRAAQDWFEHNVGDKDKLREIIGSLPSFQPGEAWLLSPDWLSEMDRLQVRRRWTYHAGRTPKRGEQPVAPKRVELGKAIEQFRAAAAKRQITVTQERDLKAENAELKKQLVAAKRSTVQQPTAVPDETAIERRVAAATASLQREHQAALKVQEQGHIKLERAVLVAVDGLERIAGQLRTSMNGTAPAIAAPTPPVVSPTPPPRRPDLPAPYGGEGIEGLRSGVVRMLRELAVRHPLHWTKAQMATLTGFSVKGGTFGTYVGELRRRGLIEIIGNDVRVTEAGLDAVGEIPEAPTTHEAIMEMWQRKLRAGCFKLLQAVADVGPEGIDRATLAESTEFTMSGGTFGTYLSELRRNGLVSVDGATVRATELLFP